MRISAAHGWVACMYGCLPTVNIECRCTSVDPNVLFTEEPTGTYQPPDAPPPPESPPPPLKSPPPASPPLASPYDSKLLDSEPKVSNDVAASLPLTPKVALCPALRSSLLVSLPSLAFLRF